MVTQMKAIVERQLWQTVLKEGVSRLDELLALLHLTVDDFAMPLDAASEFPVKIPRGFIQRMHRGDPHDPLLRQVLPLRSEREDAPHYSLDPLAEQDANPLPGVLHKYHGRVLLTLATHCAVHCRYCFRRHFPYEDNNPGTLGWQTAVSYIQADPSISEVILSGGDPLLVSDAFLVTFLTKLSQLPQLKRLRIHTRLPIVLPERITEQLTQLFAQLSIPTIVVIHSNHAQELDHSVRGALLRLKDANVTLLNQAVLLKGVNDSVESLQTLSERLFEYGVLPYYLHQLDPVVGTQHFAVDLEEGRALMQELAARLPGYLLPKFVYEKAGAAHKILIGE